jgi:DNA-directed RNA polymerase specialized sigma24 family protein
MITHRCGTTIPADIETYVRHLAYCPETHDEIAGWCCAIVNAVDHEIALVETSRETRDLTPAEMAAMHRDGEGDSLRDIAAIAGVAPETVRRRIAKWKRGGA